MISRAISTCPLWIGSKLPPKKPTSAPVAFVPIPWSKPLALGLVEEGEHVTLAKEGDLARTGDDQGDASFQGEVFKYRSCGDTSGAENGVWLELGRH